MAGTPTPNSSAIRFCVSQMVSGMFRDHEKRPEALLPRSVFNPSREIDVNSLLFLINTSSRGQIQVINNIFLTLL